MHGVIIDVPSRKAQDDICNELQKLNPIAIKAVDQKELMEHASEKWDLADDIPESFGNHTLNALLECGEKKRKFPRNRRRFFEVCSKAHFSGESCVIQVGEIKAALVPYEDMELLEAMEV